MKDAQWLFFDLGSTLLDESECYRRRVLEMTDGTHVGYDQFFADMMAFYRQGKKGDLLAARKHGFALPAWKSEYERLYPDAVSCLESLRGKFALGVIANQLPGTTERLRTFGILPCFDLVISSAEVGFAKPDPEIFRLALGRAECSPGQAVMIGDRLDNDIAPANRLGMTTVRVLRGFGQFALPSCPEETPDFTVGSLDELSRLFA